MNTVQTFIDLLKAELEQSFTPHGYTVQAREPVESEVGEGSTGPGERQVFISTGGFSFPEGIADFGGTVRVEVPVIVSTVMGFPKSEEATAAVLRRRLTVVQALQRAAQSHATAHPDQVLNLVVDDEEPQNIEGYYVSVVGLLLTFDLDTQEEL